MPNAVAQKRKTTLAAERMAGRSAGRVTVRSTWRGVAPRAAAACSRRGSRPSHQGPTVRTTTDTLKKTSAARIAVGVPSSPSPPSGPDDASSVRKATPTTTVGSTNGTVTSPRSSDRPGRSTRWSRCAIGSPSTSVASVASVEVHTVNHAAPSTRGLVSVSSTLPTSRWPAGKKPSRSMPRTGSTKNTARTASGTAPAATASAVYRLPVTRRSRRSTSAATRHGAPRCQRGPPRSGASRAAPTAPRTPGRGRPRRQGRRTCSPGGTPGRAGWS